MSSLDEGVEERDEIRCPFGQRLSLSGNGCLVPSCDRARERSGPAESCPVVDRGTNQRHEDAPICAGRAKKAFRRVFEGDEEVRRYRRGRMIRRPVLVADLDGRHGELRCQRAREREGSRRRSRHRRAGAGEGRTGLRDRHQWVKAECLVWAERGKTAGAGAVTDESSRKDGRAGHGDLFVGNREGNGVVPVAVEAMTERAVEERRRPYESVSHSSVADHGTTAFPRNRAHDIGHRHIMTAIAAGDRSVTRNYARIEVITAASIHAWNCD